MSWQNKFFIFNSNKIIIMTYQCNHSFTSSIGHYYSSGQIITEYDYYKLTSLERRFFTEYNDDDDDDIIDDVIDIAEDVAIVAEIASLFSDDSDSGSSDDSNSFDGFGGGDSGGGGASGDW